MEEQLASGLTSLDDFAPEKQLENQLSFKYQFLSKINRVLHKSCMFVSFLVRKIQNMLLGQSPRDY